MDRGAYPSLRAAQEPALSARDGVGLNSHFGKRSQFIAATVLRTLVPKRDDYSPKDNQKWADYASHRNPT